MHICIEGVRVSCMQKGHLTRIMHDSVWHHRGCPRNRGAPQESPPMNRSNCTEHRGPRIPGCMLCKVTCTYNPYTHRKATPWPAWGWS